GFESFSICRIDILSKNNSRVDETLSRIPLQRTSFMEKLRKLFNFHNYDPILFQKESKLPVLLRVGSRGWILMGDEMPLTTNFNFEIGRDDFFKCFAQ